MTLAIRDEQAPWNNGIWRVIHEAGHVQANLFVGGSNDANVSLTIQAFSQAYWGQPSLEQVRRAGLVTVTNENGFRLLAHLLPSVPGFTLDFF